MTERFAEVPGGELRIRLRGPEDGARLLVLHGGPGLSDTYLDALIDEFADTFRVAVYAQRGVAPSTAGGPFDLALQTDDAVTVLDALGWGDAVVLGHSWGGHLLLHLVAAHADRVTEAIALDPIGAVGDGGIAEFGEALMSRLSPESIERLGAPELGADEQLALIWPAYFPPGSVPPPIPDTSLDVAVMEAGQGGIAPALAELAAELRGSTVPILFITPAGSPIPASASAATAAVIGDAASVRPAGIGHFPWLVEPGAVRAAVDEFHARRP